MATVSMSPKAGRRVWYAGYRNLLTNFKRSLVWSLAKFDLMLEQGWPSFASLREGVTIKNPENQLASSHHREICEAHQPMNFG